MKKLLSVAAIALFFLILLGAILYKLLGTSNSPSVEKPLTSFPQAQNAYQPAISASQFVGAFYTWYIQSFTQDPLFPHPENRDAVLAPWLTEEFLQNWDQLVQDSEASPILLTAEDPNTWGTGISATTQSESKSAGIVHLTLGSRDALHAYTVVLTKMQNGTWRIASVGSSI